MNKATITRGGSGLNLAFPKTGPAPMLFLEAIEQYQQQNRKSKYPLTYTVKTVPGELDPSFRVEFGNAILETVMEIKDYINANL